MPSCPLQVSVSKRTLYLRDNLIAKSLRKSLLHHLLSHLHRMTKTKGREACCLVYILQLNLVTVIGLFKVCKHFLNNATNCSYNTALHWLLPKSSSSSSSCSQNGILLCFKNSTNSLISPPPCTVQKTTAYFSRPIENKMLLIILFAIRDTSAK